MAKVEAAPRLYPSKPERRRQACISIKSAPYSYLSQDRITVIRVRGGGLYRRAFKYGASSRLYPSQGDASLVCEVSNSANQASESRVGCPESGVKQHLLRLIICRMITNGKITVKYSS